MELESKNLYEPITGDMIQKYIPDALILKYGELRKYKKLPPLPLVLLYETKNNFGHWTSILRTPEGIEHFDSYGYKPDEEFEFIPKKFRYKSNQDHKYLLDMLIKSKEPVNYSQYNLQGDLPMATCGRWVILRNLFKDLTIDQFAHMILKTRNQLRKEVSKKITSDDIVANAIT